MLKFIYDTESEIPANVRAFYAAGEGGKWVLQVAGAVPKAIHDSFRENNTQLKNENEELKTKFKDIDLVKYQDLLGKEQELAAGKLVKSDKLEEAVTLRLEPILKAHEKEKADLTAKLTTTTGEVAKLKINGALTDFGAKAGVKPEAMPDFIRRGADIFKLDDAGNVIALEPDGKPKFAADGYTPLTVESWVKGAAVDKGYAHLFAPSQGSGGQGSGQQGQGHGVNPFAAATKNLTAQGILYKENPAEARRLAAAAGITLP